MRAVVQRTICSSVTSEGTETGRIGEGLTVLLGVGRDDDEKDVVYTADKILNLRIFEDEAGKMNQSLLQTGGEMLVVSQFTLYGDVRHGRRPSFTSAAPPDSANRLYEEFVQYVEKQGVRVATGIFQTEMVVSLDNHGPVTILLDSKKEF
ncbi:MAG: D-tyrosyl-tRNA(Tyr) deacylase [Anaeroglobus sp.]|nr:D-tyrosyl-tRNA(Tyr) deacylase [Anaeroglobus sp.]